MIRTAAEACTAGDGGAAVTGIIGRPGVGGGGQRVGDGVFRPEGSPEEKTYNVSPPRPSPDRRVVARTADLTSVCLYGAGRGVEIGSNHARRRHGRAYRRRRVDLRAARTTRDRRATAGRGGGSIVSRADRRDVSIARLAPLDPFPRSGRFRSNDRFDGLRRLNYYCCRYSSEIMYHVVVLKINKHV